MAVNSLSPESVGAALLRSIRTARLFTVGDQVAPCAILWPDAERQWESLINQLQTQVPELCVLGSFAPDRRTGPAVWLRCVEGRTVEPRFPADLVPILYLPGVSRQQLRATEECPADLQPLVELLFRGAVWPHPNGKDWTPLGFLTSEHGGLECDVSRDSATGEALLRALPVLLREPVASLRAGRLDTEFFNNLLAPDLPSQVLRWMNEPAHTKGQKTPEGTVSGDPLGVRGHRSGRVALKPAGASVVGGTPVPAGLAPRREGTESRAPGGLREPRASCSSAPSTLQALAHGPDGLRGG
jgi:hypothetical protein